MAAAESEDLLNAINHIKIAEEETKDLTTEPTSLQKLENFHESYFNWVDPKFEESGATPEEIITIICSKFLEHAKYEETSLKYLGVERIGDKATLAFAYFHTGNMIEAKTALAEGRDFIRICSKNSYIAEEYLAGCDYVFDCLEVFLSIKENPEEDQKLDWPVQDYKDLAPKTKAAVLALKYYFNRQLRKGRDEQMELLNEMISLDPNPSCPDWYCAKAQYSKHCRNAKLDLLREGGEKRIRLKLEDFEDEIAELELAKSVSTDHPIVMTAYCHLVAELSSHLIPNYIRVDFRKPLICGTLSFRNLGQVSSFLKSECEKILGIYDHCARIYTTIAEIFMKLLNWRYRDLEFAERCLRRVIDIHPTSSKGHHRLTAYFLRTRPPNLTEAEKYCSLALEYDATNFPACSDLVKLLLRNPLLNEGKIMNIMENYLKDEIVPLSPRNKSDLLLYKGLLQHATGHKLDAVESWINAQVILQDKLEFGELKYKIGFYNWPKELLTIQKIQETVEFANKDSTFSLGKEEQMRILLETLTNVKYGHRVTGQGRFEGRGGFNRSQNPPRGHGQRFQNRASSSDNNWRARTGNDTN